MRDIIALMDFAFINTLSAVDASAWNELVKDEYPFARHEFLLALEETGCIGGSTGWTAHHLIGREEGALRVAVPLYIKRHSYGEYVFDWSWANAYAQAGIHYYPKLVAAIPFTPATGPRLLCHPETPRAPALLAAIQAIEHEASRLQASSGHVLFPDEADAEVLARSGWLRREGFQYHWERGDYADFDGFLAQFAAQKRKKIRHERKEVAAAGIRLDTVSGRDMMDRDWQALAACYRDTIEKHGAIAYLNPSFFRRLGAVMPEALVVVLARRGDEPVAAALNFRSRHTLYGRYWGALAEVPCLHFEACYYTPIQFCLEHGLSRFEAGAQGEHKLSRGLLPRPTVSYHWIADAGFRKLIHDFLERERLGLARHLETVETHSPFRCKSS